MDNFVHKKGLTDIFVTLLAISYFHSALCRRTLVYNRCYLVTHFTSLG